MSLKSAVCCFPFFGLILLCNHLQSSCRMWRWEHVKLMIASSSEQLESFLVRGINRVSVLLPGSPVGDNFGFLIDKSRCIVSILQKSGVLLGSLSIDTYILV
ncbi:hypothetical protein DL98DRAFT_511094 [Cadophora sp. DSE1049]|nr:hypothetical protein DL98DRAFT_511094 [Cadophora sp. DSE1049]